MWTYKSRSVLDWNYYCEKKNHCGFKCRAVSVLLANDLLDSIDMVHMIIVIIFEYLYNDNEDTKQNSKGANMVSQLTDNRRTGMWCPRAASKQTWLGCIWFLHRILALCLAPRWRSLAPLLAAVQLSAIPKCWWQLIYHQPKGSKINS